MQGYAPVLRLERIDEGRASDPYVLLRASQHGPNPLDLKFLATESRAEYTGSLKHSQISSLRAKNYDENDVKWEDILRRTFDPYDLSPSALQPASATGTSLEDAEQHECVANVIEGRELTLIWRRKSNGIIQRLGSLTLQPAKVDGEIDLFEWCISATQALSRASNDISIRERQFDKAQKKVQELDRQLNELTKAKAENEAELVTKFCDLINAKKLKIRDQQRLLASAQPTKELAQQLRDAAEVRTIDSPNTTSSRRQTKRKATCSLKGESESDDGFEPARQEDTDMQDDDDDRAFAQQETPEPSDDGTDSDDLDGKVSSGRSSMPNPPTRASQSQSQAMRNSSTHQSQPFVPEANLNTDLPAQRQLPFAKPPVMHTKPNAPQKESESAVADSKDEETESDDEL